MEDNNTEETLTQTTEQSADQVEQTSPVQESKEEIETLQAETSDSNSSNNVSDSLNGEESVSSTPSNDDLAFQDTVSADRSESRDNSETESRPEYRSSSSTYHTPYRRGPSYRTPNRYSDRRSSSYKDRDTRLRIFRKYDKIAAKKLDIDYKNPSILREFITEEGKILSTAFTGTSAKNQRRLIREIKRARYIGLLPSA